MAETKNLKAMQDIIFLSSPQLYLAKTLWILKKDFDARRSSPRILSESDFALIVKIFSSHWFRIDHCTINLGHEPLSERYANDGALHRESKARLFEVTRWLKNLGFIKVDKFYPKTGKSGMNSHVMSKGEINFALNEGIDGASESQISEYVRLWGEGLQHLAIDVPVIMPDIVRRQAIQELGVKIIDKDVLRLTFVDIRELKPEYLDTNDINRLELGTDRSRVSGLTIRLLVAMLEKAGFTFLTKIYAGTAADGQKLWQCFTDEIDRGFFFELIERKGERGRFVPGTVQGLYEDIERKQLQK